MGEMTETPQSRFWETTPLHRMTRAEWESLCDGCGKCCIHKLEDDETGELYPTNIACKLLDRRTGQCSDYRRRHAFVPECVRLTPAKLRQLEWLPTTCAYRLIDEGRPLPDWHHLVSGDREAVHRAGESVRGWTVSEEDVGDFENHIVDRIL
nr:YcgN family cysteine cluster protein [Sphingomonas profundi]